MTSDLNALYTKKKTEFCCEGEPCVQHRSITAPHPVPCPEKAATQHTLQTRSEVHTDPQVLFPTLKTPRLQIPIPASPHPCSITFLPDQNPFKSQSTSSTHRTPPRLGRLSHLDARTSTSRSLEYLRSGLALRPPSHRHPPSFPASPQPQPRWARLLSRISNSSLILAAVSSLILTARSCSLSSRISASRAAFRAIRVSTLSPSRFTCGGGGGGGGGGGAGAGAGAGTGTGTG
jgi:hypothetical protein